MASCMGQGGVILFGFGAMMATTRLLGAEGYGRLTVFFMALNVITKLLLGWPNIALVRFGRQDEAAGLGAGPVFWTRACMFLPCVAAAAAGAALFRSPLAAFLDMGEAGAWVLLAYAVLLGGVEMLTAAFQALGRFRLMAALPAAFKFLKCALLAGLYFAVTRQSDVGTVLSLHVASVGFVFAWGVCAALRSGLGPPRFDAARARRIAAYAWPAVFGGAALWVVAWVDTLVLRAFAPMEELGIYGAAYQSVYVLGGLRAAVTAVLWPFVMSLAAGGRTASLRRLLDEMLPAAAVLAGLGLAVVGAGAELMPVLFGAEFAPGVLPCQTLVAGVAFTIVGALAAQVSNAFDRVGRVAAVSFAMAGVNLAGDLLLVPIMGAQGAALSTLAAFAVAAALGIRVVNGIREVSGASGRRYLALACLAPALAVPAVGAAAPSLGWRLAAYGFVLLVWTFAMRLGGVVSSEALGKLGEIDLPGPARWALAAAEAVLVRDRRGAR